MKRTILALTLILCAVLTSCGGGGPKTTINVILTDFQFTPNSFTIPAGAEITVNATNSGAVVHDFIIMKQGTTVGDDVGEEDEENIYWEIEVNPAQEGTGTFIAPTEPGEYQLVCGTPGHFMAGMIGKIIVVADGGE